MVNKQTTAPDGEALPDAERLPNAPNQQVLLGQPAIVTGANAGIGEAVAIGLAKAGADAADDVTGATLFVDGGMTLYPGFATGG